MSRTISTRLAGQEHLDRSALIRKMLLEDIEADRMEQALAGYRRGDLGVEEAAERAGVSLWRFVDEAIHENVRPPTAGREQLQRELAESIETLSGG